MIYMRYDAKISDSFRRKILNLETTTDEALTKDIASIIPP